MKKNGLLLCIIVFVILVVSSCNTKTPPALNVVCGTGKKVLHKTATLGTYGWSWPGGGVQSDSISPMDMEKDGIITSFEIDVSECYITITFKDDCKNFTINKQLISSGELEIIGSKTNTNTYSFVAKADCVYSINAVFDKGDAVYVFSVKSK
jgi:hypothetical protein